MLSEATITSKGQVTIPAEIRAKLGLEAGHKLVFSICDNGRLEVRVRRAHVGSGRGALNRHSVKLPEGDLREFIEQSVGEAMTGKLK